MEAVVLQLTCLMFELSPSPIELKGTTKPHLEWYKKYQPKTVMWLRKSMHDVIGGGDNMESAKTFKENIVKTVNEAGFKLHKWHFSVAELEEEEDASQIEIDETYTKQQLNKGYTKTIILEIP